MKKFNISSIRSWNSFVYLNKTYDLSHLNHHKVDFKTKNNGNQEFIVSYGLHCFTKNNNPSSIPLKIKDCREEREVDLERYNASKKLKNIISNLDKIAPDIYSNYNEKYLFFNKLENLSNIKEPFIIIFTSFKENRLNRIHVISCYFLREEKNYKDYQKFSIFKIITETIKSKKNKRAIKEVYNKK